MLAEFISKVVLSMSSVAALQLQQPSAWILTALALANQETRYGPSWKQEYYEFATDYLFITENCMF